MPIIKLDAIDSTNSYLRLLCMEEIMPDFTAVVANQQTNGRGQMGTNWNSETSKNLTFSVFKDLSSLKTEHPFFISIAVALALVKTLRKFSVNKLNIKWPNDILSENKKICGILIENVIKRNKLNASIIGIGLNVNQTEFKNLPKASSLKLVSGKVFDLDEILDSILFDLKYYFFKLECGEFYDLKEEYENYLFKKNKPSTFKNADGSLFVGIIKSISLDGKLQVLLEDDILKEFDLKVLTLLY